MNNALVSDAEVQEILQWMIDNAVKLAAARANRIHADEMRKHLKALLMQDSPAKSAVDRECDAYASPRYVEHLGKLRQAVYVEELLKAEFEARKAKLAAWQTHSANVRGIR